MYHHQFEIYKTWVFSFES